MKSNRLLTVFIIFLVISGTLIADEDDAREMMNMVADQDLEGLKGLIADGADINAQDYMQGMTALSMACAYGYIDFVEYLISEGADVNIQDTMYRSSPLFTAVYTSEEMTKLLLANGADIHLRSREGTTAFTMSVFGALNGSVTTDIASLLLEMGADVDETPAEGPVAGYTCLMMIAGAGSPELVKYLLANGADINAEAKDGSTAMSMAMRENNTEMVALLKENGATQ